MYCPHCGNESSGELNYCKRCGGNLNPPALNSPQETRPVILPSTAWAMGVTMFLLVVFGLVAVFSALDKLAERGVTPPVLVLTVIFGALTILGGASLLTFLWTRVLGSPRAASSAPPQLVRPSATSELPPARVGTFADSHIPSVTEHTTRTFDNVRRDR
jgi:hypothetical protein